MKRPLENEYPSFYKNYVDGVKTDNIIKELRDQVIDIQALISEIPEDKEDYAYAAGKWTIKEIIQHIIDTERIFAYRALRISRNDQTSLPGFDENDFANNTAANERGLQDLLTEFSAVRHSNLLLFKSFSEEQLLRIGIASDHPISVRAIGFMLIGHQKQHQKVFEERYL